MKHIMRKLNLRISVLGVRIILSVLIILIMLIIKLRSAAGNTAAFRERVTEGGETAAVISYLFDAYNGYTGTNGQNGERTAAGEKENESTGIVAKGTWERLTE